MVLRLRGGAKKRMKKTYTKPKKIKHKHKKVKLSVLQFYKVNDSVEERGGGRGEDPNGNNQDGSQSTAGLILCLCDFRILVTLQATITRMTLSQDEQKKRMVISMKAKYDKYWDNVDNMNYVLYVAVVLDPRNKLAYVSYCIELIYGKGSEKCKEIVGKVSKILDELFNHYKGKSE
ncbi:hypothetical protein LXL04_007907 [Taraxacum kok-saghyz]